MAVVAPPEQETASWDWKRLRSELESVAEAHKKEPSDPSQVERFRLLHRELIRRRDLARDRNNDGDRLKAHAIRKKIEAILGEEPYLRLTSPTPAKKGAR